MCVWVKSSPLLYCMVHGIEWLLVTSPPQWLIRETGNNVLPDVSFTWLLLRFVSFRWRLMKPWKASSLSRYSSDWYDIAIFIIPLSLSVFCMEIITESLACRVRFVDHPLDFIVICYKMPTWYGTLWIVLYYIINWSSESLPIAYAEGKNSSSCFTSICFHIDVIS